MGTEEVEKSTFKDRMMSDNLPEGWEDEVSQEWIDKTREFLESAEVEEDDSGTEDKE